ncbi:MAG: hypothetical protein PHD60_09340 [Clostridia bacterium]|nr:hypothetical protein [Clostridia bacterium]
MNDQLSKIENWFYEISREEQLEKAREFYRLRGEKDFSTREWDSWGKGGRSSQAISKRFGGFTKFKIEAGIKTNSKMGNLSPEEVTNHLLNCIEHKKTRVSRSVLEKYNEEVGKNIGHGYYEKYWNNLKNQYKRCIEYREGRITKDELITPITVCNKEKKLQKKGNHSEIEAWDFARKCIEFSGLSIDTPSCDGEGNTYRQGAFGNADFNKYLDGKEPDFIVVKKYHDTNLFLIECKNSKTKLIEGIQQVERDASLINNSGRYKCPFVCVIAGNNYEGFRIEIRKLYRKSYLLTDSKEIKKNDNFMFSFLN